MPTTTLNPASIGTFDSFTLTAGATKVIAVTTPDDDNTTYLTEGTPTDRQSFNMDDLPTEAAVVTAHTMRVRLRNDSIGSPQAKPFIRSGGVNSDGTAISITGAWVTYSQTDIVSLQTPALVNAAECGLLFTTDGGGDVVNWTTLTWDVSWERAGGLVFLLLSLGPLCAVGLHEMSKLASLIQARTGTLIRPHEYLDAWRELKSYRHPRHIFLGV